MANYDDFERRQSYRYEEMSYGQSASYDVAANTMAKSFLIMVVALFVTAGMAYFTATNENMILFMADNIFLLCILEFAVVIGASFAIRKNKAVIAGVLFSGYCIINGMTLSVIFFAYDIGSIAEIFVLSAILFCIMSIFGFITKRDLSSVGSVCMMALIGILVTTLLNAFIFHSTGIAMVMNYIGVFVFIGLTAFDMWRLKRHALNIPQGNANSIAVYFAMELYLDLINLFLYLLRIFGERK